MSDQFSTALTLLVVGMLTVFSILAFVVIFGNILIKVVNKYFPEQKKVVARKVSAISDLGKDSKKVAAIVAAVDIVTGGKGKVTSIKKSE